MNIRREYFPIKKSNKTLAKNWKKKISKKMANFPKEKFAIKVNLVENIGKY